MRLKTHTVHRFFEFVITASAWGYHVTEYHHEDVAYEEVHWRLAYDPDYLVVDDWQAFIDQSPCRIPADVVDCIADFYVRD